MQATKLKIPFHFFRTTYVTNTKNKISRLIPKACYNSTTLDTVVVDLLTNDLLQQQRTKSQQNNRLFGDNDIKCYSSETEISKTKEYAEMSCEQIDNVILDLLARNKDKQITELINTCSDYSKLVSESTLKKLFRSYSITGKTDKVILLQKYCSIVDPNLYKRNGEFMHYLAKAHCYKGNSEKGLSILSHCYKKYDGLRGFYRIIFRELIQDSVLNRSEATLVIFKKYVLEFSNKLEDNYPLICFWYICWSSTWFSDQMLANELLENSEKLQNIVKDKATTFSINILREYNDDAVLRLLQSLLKYKMMSEYVKVLQVLFGYKYTVTLTSSTVTVSSEMPMSGGLWNVCENIIRESEEVQPLSTLSCNSLKEEVGRYLRSPNISRGADPFVFWRNDVLYPKLKKMAQKYF